MSPRQSLLPEAVLVLGRIAWSSRTPGPGVDAAIHTHWMRLGDAFLLQAVGAIKALVVTYSVLEYRQITDKNVGTHHLY